MNTIYEPKSLTLRAYNRTDYALLEVWILFPSGALAHNSFELSPRVFTNIHFREDDSGEAETSGVVVVGDRKEEVVVDMTIARLFKAERVTERGVNRFGRLLHILFGNHRESDDYDLHGAELKITLHATMADGDVFEINDSLKGKCGTLGRDSPYVRRFVLNGEIKRK